MKIELTNVKHLASLSEETFCFTATVVVDGKKAFTASNHGHGGPTDFYPVAGYTGPSEREVTEWLKANRKPLEGHGMSLPVDLELEVNELLENHLAAKRLARMLKSKIVVLVEDAGKEPALATYPAKYKPTPANLEILAKRGEQVVNGNAALEARALALV